MGYNPHKYDRHSAPMEKMETFGDTTLINMTGIQHNAFFERMNTFERQPYTYDSASLGRFYKRQMMPFEVPVSV